MSARLDDLAAVAAEPTAPAAGRRRPDLARRLAANPGVAIGAAILLAVLALAVLAPLLGTTDPARIDPAFRNTLPGAERTLADGTPFTHRMGTDSLGRDVYSRVLHGGRVSLVVGLAVAAASVAIGSRSASPPATCAGSTGSSCA